MEKEKNIETKEFKIKGNIMCWTDTMVQLSNISCISTAKLAKKPFPKWSLILFVLGILFIEDELIIALFLWIAGGVWIYMWYKKNQEIEALTSLNVLMNSGNTLQIIMEDRKFLNKVLGVLERIIIDGGVGNQQVSINIQDCKISGNARVLDELKIKG